MIQASTSVTFLLRVTLVFLIVAVVLTPVSMAETKTETADTFEEILIIHQEHIAVLRKREPEASGITIARISEAGIHHLVNQQPFTLPKLYLLYGCLKVFD